jgi:tRNA pseudouridine32 synthase/23S rRNA pseudouridine746 synthase
MHDGDGDGDDENTLFIDITADQYNGALPQQFTYPFHYEPHPVATWACDQVKKQLTETDAFQEDVGKMFGVLIVRRTTAGDNNTNNHYDQCLGYLKAFSGTLNKSPLLMDAGGGFCFCPMIYDRMDAEGFYKQGEAELNAINKQVEELEQHPEWVQRQARLAAIDLAKKRLGMACRQQKARRQQRKQLLSKRKATIVGGEEEYQALEYDLIIHESAKNQRQIKALKAQLQLLVAQEQVSSSGGEIEGRIKDLKLLRQKKSFVLQNRLFDKYQFLNIRGEKALVLDIFAETALRRPPAGAGDCAAPKLLQVAFARGYTPIAMAEFWWGGSPVLEVRKHNFYYPACRGKCEPILGHMLQGLDVEDNPLLLLHNNSPELEILFEDEYMVVVNKPAEMLSVPGRQVQHSVYTEMKKRYPNATGPLMVHRLDMSTSGVLLVAKDKDIHKKLSAQFIDRSVKKRYECLLEGEYTNDPKGKIDIPLTGDYLNRPMQKVDFDEGKPAVTFYEVVKIAKGRTRVYFYPVTGRTHQLRVHAAHAMGLNIPIVGDDIYGERDERLCLHAGFLQLTHPVTQKRMTFTAKAPF